jgi:ribosomal protein L37E
MEVKILMKNENGAPLAATCRVCGKFTLDTRDFLCASCTFEQFMRSFFIPTVSHSEQTTTKEDNNVSKS